MHALTVLTGWGDWMRAVTRCPLAIDSCSYVDIDLRSVSPVGSSNYVDVYSWFAVPLTSVYNGHTMIDCTRC